MFEKDVFDLAGLGRFGDERARGACGILGKEDGDGLAVGRPPRRGEKTFHVGEFLGGPAKVRDIKLKLTRLLSVRKKSNSLTVRRPRDRALRVWQVFGPRATVV